MYPLLPRVGQGADLPVLPSEDRPTVRRSAPEALRFESVSPGWPPLRVEPVRPAAPGSGWGWLRAVWPVRTPRAHPVR
jgi:hypothetical protein